MANHSTISSPACAPLCRIGACQGCDFKRARDDREVDRQRLTELDTPCDHESCDHPKTATTVTTLKGEQVEYFGCGRPYTGHREQWADDWPTIKAQIEEEAQRILIEETRPELQERCKAAGLLIEDKLDKPIQDNAAPHQWWTPFDDFEQPTQPPTPFFARDDGRLLLYWRSLSWLYGPSGFGKSWVALMAAKQALDNDYNVAYIDYELGVDDFKERALMLGLWKHLKDGSLRHVEGHNLELGDRAEIADWCAADDGEGLIIIDSAGSAGCPDDSPKGVPEWLAEHIRPFQLLPDHKRPAIVVVDHVSKNPQGRAPGPIGAQAKMREVTGIAMKITGNPWTRTESGTITLICEKDRRGYWKKDDTMSTITGELERRGVRLPDW